MWRKKRECPRKRWIEAIKREIVELYIKNWREKRKVPKIMKTNTKAIGNQQLTRLVALC